VWLKRSSLGWLLAWLKWNRLEVVIRVVSKKQIRVIKRGSLGQLLEWFERSSLGWLLAWLKRSLLEVVIREVKKGQFGMVKRGSL